MTRLWGCDACDGPTEFWYGPVPAPDYGGMMIRACEDCAPVVGLLAFLAWVDDAPVECVYLALGHAPIMATRVGNFRRLDPGPRSDA